MSGQRRRDRRARAKGRLGVTKAERYALIPADVLASPAVATLSPATFKVLIVLAAQYWGKNNGRITLPLSVAREYGIRSKDTLCRGLRELVERGVIVETHKGGLPPFGCSRYTLTWRDLDPDEASGKVLPTPASHSWAKWTPTEDRRQFKRKTDRPVRSTDQSGPINGPQHPPAGPMSGPQSLDHWSDERTLSRSRGGGRAGSASREGSVPALQSRGPKARPAERILKLLRTLPHLSDHEVGRILGADALDVRSLRASMEMAS